MKDQLRKHVESLFQEAPQTKRAVDLKEELISNLQDRYTDLLEQGKEPEVAYQIALAGIGDVDELLKGLRGQDVFDAAALQRRRSKSALLVSLAVALYIISFVPVILLGSMGNAVEGACLMFLCWAAGTFCIIYNVMSRPKYVRADETIVEEFKEWQQEKTHRDNVRKRIYSIVWMTALLAFIAIGYFFGAFHLAWPVFVLALVVNQIIRLIFIYREEGK